MTTATRSMEEESSRATARRQDLESQRQRFNPNEHIIQLPQGKNKPPSEYLEVKWRLVWLRQDHPEATILTEIVSHDPDVECSAEVTRWENGRPIKETKVAPGRATIRAVVTLGTGAYATAMKSETAVSFPDYLEKAETGAIGRALAMLGFGTQFTGDEFDEGERIVDAPVTRSAPSQNGSKPASQVLTHQPPNEKQLEALATVGIKPEVGKLLDFNNVGGSSQGIRVINTLYAEKRKHPEDYKKYPQKFIAEAFAKEGLQLDPDE